MCKVSGDTLSAVLRSCLPFGLVSIHTEVYFGLWRHRERSGEVLALGLGLGLGLGL